MSGESSPERKRCVAQLALGVPQVTHEAVVTLLLGSSVPRRAALFL